MNEFKDTDIAKGWVDMHRAAGGSDARNASFWAYEALDEPLRSPGVATKKSTLNSIFLRLANSRPTHDTKRLPELPRTSCVSRFSH